jgi:hypothetical protein
MDRRKLYKMDIYASDRIRTHNPNKRAAADPCLTPHGHCDQEASVSRCLHYTCYSFFCGTVLVRFLTLDTHSKDKRRTSTPSAGLELAISAVEQLTARLLETLVWIPCVIWITVRNWYTSYQPSPHGVIDSILLAEAFLRVQQPFSPAASACATAYEQNRWCYSWQHIDGSIRRPTNHEIKIKP